MTKQELITQYEEIQSQFKVMHFKENFEDNSTIIEVGLLKINALLEEDSVRFHKHIIALLNNHEKIVFTMSEGHVKTRAVFDWDGTMTLKFKFS